MSKRTQDYISNYAGNNIRYFPALAHSLQSPNAAVMLSQLMYWQDMGHRHDGYFYKTAQELFYETGLSQDKLNSARKLLVSMGLIDTKLRGIPAKTHYYVNTEEVADMLTTWRKAAPKELRDSLFQIAKKQETITETTHHTTHRQPRNNYQSLPLNSIEVKNQTMSEILSDWQNDTLFVDDEGLN